MNMNALTLMQFLPPQVRKDSVHRIAKLKSAMDEVNDEGVFVWDSPAGQQEWENLKQELDDLTLEWSSTWLRKLQDAELLYSVDGDIPVLLSPWHVAHWTAGGSKVYDLSQMAVQELIDAVQDFTLDLLEDSGAKPNDTHPLLDDYQMNIICQEICDHFRWALSPGEDRCFHIRLQGNPDGLTPLEVDLAELGADIALGKTSLSDVSEGYANFDITGLTIYVKHLKSGGVQFEVLAEAHEDSVYGAPSTSPMPMPKLVRRKGWITAGSAMACPPSLDLQLGAKVDLQTKHGPARISTIGMYLGLGLSVLLLRECVTHVTSRPRKKKKRKGSRNYRRGLSVRTVRLDLEKMHRLRQVRHSQLTPKQRGINSPAVQPRGKYNGPKRTIGKYERRCWVKESNVLPHEEWVDIRQGAKEELVLVWRSCNEGTYTIGDETVPDVLVGRKAGEIL